MGIRNFNKLVGAYTSGHQNFPMQRLKNKNVAIDAFLWLYEIKSRMKNNRKTFRTNFFEKMHPITSQNPANVFFVFDGKAPIEKAECIRKRREEKEKMYKKYGEAGKQIRINKDDLQMYKNAIRSSSEFSIFQSVDEAEATMVLLWKEQQSIM